MDDDVSGADQLPDQTPLPWWWGLPPLSAPVSCGGESHRLRWAEGRLDLVDHGAPDRERALGALAGEQSGCLLHYDAWHRHTADPAVLVIAGRGAGDLLYVPDPAAGSGPMPGATAMPGMAPRRAAAGWVAYTPMPSVYRGSMSAGGPRRPGPSGSVAPADDTDLLLLFGLGPAWADRLAGTVIAALLDVSGPGADLPAALRVALYGRVLAALRGWLGRPEMDIDLQLAAGRDDAWLDLDAEPARVALPARWLLDVWIRGVAVTLGRFCLAASPAPDGSRLDLQVVDPQGARSTIGLHLPQPRP